MLNQYPAWKYLLIVVVIVLGLLFALPNLYGERPALSISAETGTPLDSAVLEKVNTALQGAGLAPVYSQLINSRLSVQFESTDKQLAAKDLVTEQLGENYTVALNLESSVPDWLRSMGAFPMYLGLDLRGGVHFLMEVDMVAAVKKDEERLINDLRTQFRSEKLRYKSLSRTEEGGIVARFRDVETFEKAKDLVQRTYDDLSVTSHPEDDELTLRMVMTEQAVKASKTFALEQNITTLRNRVNELGVAEPVIQRQGDERIVVQLPGIQDPARAKDILGATATLEFRAVDDSVDAADGKVPAASRLYRFRDGGPILLKKRVIITGDYITSAASGIEQESGSPMVNISLDGRGGRLMRNHTRDNVGRRMGVVFIENKIVSKRVDGELQKFRRKTEEVINAAVIRGEFGSRFQITGLDSTQEARDLALLLRAGALAAPIEIIEERTVGPSLGQDNIDQGFKSVVLGFTLVLILMPMYYRIFGLIADVALTMNLVLLVAVLSMLQATLTLPGIAGIVLTVGMAVDANVLIFQRIREELSNGNTAHASIHAGYEKAFSTIFDANITTLIAAVVLFGFGTGPIKGFAITLSIGIVTSMFTAIMGTRAIVNLVYGGKKLEKLAI